MIHYTAGDFNRAKPRRGTVSDPPGTGRWLLAILLVTVALIIALRLTGIGGGA